MLLHDFLFLLAVHKANNSSHIGSVGTITINSLDQAIRLMYPMAYWPLNEAALATTAVDVMGNYSATYNTAGGFTLGSPAILPGASASSVSASGSSYIAETASITSLAVPNFTVFGVFILNSSSKAQTIMGLGNPSTSDQQGFNIFTDSANKNIGINYWSDKGYGGALWISPITNTNPITSGVPFTLAVSVATISEFYSVCNIYINGSLALSTTSGTYPYLPPTSPFSFIIGGNLGATNYFTGNISNVAYWNRVLTPYEQYVLYKTATGVTSISAIGSTYKAVVLADSPAAYWSCHQAAGATLIPDETGNGHDMTVNTADTTVSLGNTALYPSATGSLQTTSLSWGASNSTTLGLDVTKGISLECFLLLTNTNSNGIAIGADASSTSVGYPSIVASIGVEPGGASNTGFLFSGLNNSSSSFSSTDVSYVMPSDIAHHIVYTYDSINQVKTYVDGKPYLSGTPTQIGNFNISSGSFVLMGSITNPGSYGVTGLGSDFAVYNYVLTPEQVSAHFLASQNIAALDYKTIVLNAKPIAYWPCDEVAGSTTLTDATGNGYTMTVNTADTNVSTGNTPLRYGSKGSLQSLDLSWAAYCASNFTFNNHEYGYTFECMVVVNSSSRGNTLFGVNGSSAAAGLPAIFVGNSTTTSNTLSLSIQMPGGGGTFTVDYVVYTPIHLVYTCNLSGAYLYIDSVLSAVVPGSITAPYTFTGMNLLGSQSYPSSYGLIGKISDFAIYDKSLSQDEVTAHYKATLVPGGTAWRYWRIFIYQNNGDPTYTVIGLGTGNGVDTPPGMIWATQPGGDTIATSSMAYNQSSMYNSSDTFEDACLGTPIGGNAVWISNTPINSWGSVDFLSPVILQEIRIACQPNGTTGYNQAPKDFAIQVSSDNVNWQTMKKFYGVTQWIPGNFMTFSLVDSL